MQYHILFLPTLEYSKNTYKYAGTFRRFLDSFTKVVDCWFANGFQLITFIDLLTFHKESSTDYTFVLVRWLTVFNRKYDWSEQHSIQTIKLIQQLSFEHYNTQQQFGHVPAHSCAKVPPLSNLRQRLKVVDVFFCALNVSGLPLDSISPIPIAVHWRVLPGHLGRQNPRWHQWNVVVCKWEVLVMVLLLIPGSLQHFGKCVNNWLFVAFIMHGTYLELTPSLCWNIPAPLAPVNCRLVSSIQYVLAEVWSLDLCCSRNRTWNVPPDTEGLFPSRQSL